jgi:hypothetical protein
MRALSRSGFSPWRSRTWLTRHSVAALMRSRLPERGIRVASGQGASAAAFSGVSSGAAPQANIARAVASVGRTLATHG